MSISRDSKINQLMTDWPDGAVMTTPWLKQRGYNAQLLQRYKQGRWVESLGAGAYKKKGDQIDWIGAIAALQEQLAKPIHVGGRSALDLLGKSHYLRLGKDTLTLFGPPSTKLPTWFIKGDWKKKVSYSARNLFRETTQEFGTKAIGHTKYSEGRIEVTISAPERAFIELLDGAPESVGYDEARKIIEGLPSLRTNVLQSLLERCQSVKVKRLFLHLAEKVNHPWFRKLELEAIDLGSGKRLIYKDGQYDAKYMITVPKETDES